MPSRSNTRSICLPLSAPSLRAKVLAASSVRLTASAELTSGFGAPAEHGETDAGARHLDAARELALLDEVVARMRREDRDVEGLAAADPLDDHARRRVHDLDLVQAWPARTAPQAQR